MKIQEIKVMRGPNYWSVRRPRLIVMLLDLEEMEEFNCTEFTIGDIVRSGFVRSYLINKIKLGIGME